MGMRIALPQVMDVICTNQREVEVFRNWYLSLIHNPLLGIALILHLQKEITFT